MFSAPEFLVLILHSTGKISQKSEIVERDPRFSDKVTEKKTHVDLEISSTTVTVCLPLPLSPHPYMVLPVSQSLLVQSVSALS